MFKKIMLFGSISAIAISCLAKQDSKELIEWVKFEKHKVSVAAHKDLKELGLEQDFFAEYSDDIDILGMPRSIALLPFILNIYSLVWISGEDYSIDEMDEDTYYSLEKIKKIFIRMYPKTSFKGNILPRKLVKNRPVVPLVDKDHNTALFFSMGLDATAASFDFRDKKQLLITACGQADMPTKSPRLWQRRKKNFMAYAKQHGHTNAFVVCNYSEFLMYKKLHQLSYEIINWRAGTIEGPGLMGVVAPILYTKGYPEVHIASSFTWDYPYPSAANPLVDDNLVIADAFRLRHAHFDRTRFDKVKLIVDAVKKDNLPIPRMRVCESAKYNEFGNCAAHCAKCLSVLNSLLALGENPVPYGFNTTEEKIVASTKRYLSRRKYYWSMWNFWDIQRNLQLMKDAPESVRWILDVDLKKITDTYTVGAKKRVNWHKFKDLAPADLVIPPICGTDFMLRHHNDYVAHTSCLSR